MLFNVPAFIIDMSKELLDYYKKYSNKTQSPVVRNIALNKIEEFATPYINTCIKNIDGKKNEEELRQVGKDAVRKACQDFSNDEDFEIYLEHSIQTAINDYCKQSK